MKTGKKNAAGVQFDAPNAALDILFHLMYKWCKC